jgi:hypothetical protein
VYMSMCVSDVETWMGYCGKRRSNTNLSYSTSCSTTTLHIRKNSNHCTLAGSQWYISGLYLDQVEVYYIMRRTLPLF